MNERENQVKGKRKKGKERQTKRGTKNIIKREKGERENYFYNENPFCLFAIGEKRHRER
jgi:hypothetical protein